jgi:hypothetical protein
MAKIRHPLNEIEATQIACRIVEAYGGSINFYRLMKLLYVVEHEAWDKLEQPAIGGTYFSMEAGPLIGEMADAVNKGAYRNWSEHLSQKPRGPGTEVFLLLSAGRDEISDALLEIIDDVVQRTRSWDNEHLKRYCHRFGEYRQPSPGKRLPIQAEDILKAAGKSDEKIKKLQGESELWSKLEAALA